MILIGTDSGIYRWFDGCGWPIFHSLQGRAIVGLSSPGSGILAALDREGTVFESENNGQDWRTIPLPAGAGRPSALGVWATSEGSVLALATAGPLGLYRRVVGAAIPRPHVEPGASTAWNVERVRTLAAGATALVTQRKAAPVDLKVARAAGWATVGTPSVGAAGEVRALAFGSEATSPWLAAVRGAGLWRSPDAGVHWVRCAGVPEEVYALHTVGMRVWAGTSNGCWLSGDGGLNWEERSSGLDRGKFVTALEVKPGAPDVLLAGAGPFAPESAGQAGAGHALFESSNAGKAWSLVTKKNHPEVIERDVIADIRYDPAAPDNIVDAFASGEIHVTRNAGAYWGPLARQIRAARVLAAVV